MKILNHLTEEQQRAVTSSDRVVMLLAPAGSGKTRVLIRRIIKILEDSPNESFRILAVAYTHKATDEIRERIKRVIGDQIWRVDSHTIHSFALTWLRSYGSTVGVTHDTVVYAEDIDRFAILQRYLDTLGEQILDIENMKSIFEKFDEIRTDNLSPELLSNSPANNLGTNASLREMFDAYLISLQEEKGIDFPGMLYQFHQLLEIDPSVVNRLQRVYKHVLVDEGQDLTKLQSDILKTIVSDKLHLFVVGDERQSINSWAGGNIDYAYDLVGKEAKERKLSLSNNFRCASQILGLAQQLAKHFTNHKNDTKSPIETPPGDYDYQEAVDEEHESTIVTEWIEKLRDKRLDEKILAPGESTKIEYEEIGIIGRNKYILDMVHSNLKKMEIPLSLLTDTRDILLTSEASLLLALIELHHVNPKNLPAARKASQELHNLCKLEQTVTSDVEEIWQITNKKFPELESISKSNNIEQIVTGLENVSIANDDWNEDAKIILNWLDRYKSYTRVADRSPKGLMYYIFNAQRTQPTDPGVRLLTAHRAKGLEFRAVAVVGLNQGSFPDYRNLELPKLDEERRAFYVSITRASRLLLLTRPHTRTYRSGKTREQEPSQFLYEAGIL